MPLYRRTIVPVWKDTTGRTCTQFMVTADQTPAALGAGAPLVNAMQAMSAAGLVACYVEPLQYFGNPTGSSAYPSVDDKAQFTLRSANGNVGRVMVPAPLHGIFQADHKLVDLSNPLVHAFWLALQTALADKGGSPWVKITDARRVKTVVGG